MIKRYLIILMILFCFVGGKSYSAPFEDNKLPDTIQRQTPTQRKSISPRRKDIIPSPQPSPINMDEVKSPKEDLSRKDEEPGFLFYWVRGLIVILIIPVVILFLRKFNIEVELKSYAFPLIFLFVIYTLGCVLIIFVSNKAKKEIRNLEFVKLSKEVALEVPVEVSPPQETDKIAGIDTVSEWKVYPLLYRYSTMSKKISTNKKIERKIAPLTSPKPKATNYRVFDKHRISYKK